MCHQLFGTTCFSIFRVEDLTEDGGSSVLQKVRKFSLFSKASRSWRRLYRGRFIMFSVITNTYNKKTKGPNLMEFFTATGKLKKFFFWQLEMFDVCTTDDTAHINTIFKFLPHTRQRVCHELEYRIVLFSARRSAHTHTHHRSRRCCQTPIKHILSTCEPSYLISIKYRLSLPDDGSYVIRNMLEKFQLRVFQTFILHRF